MADAIADLNLQTTLDVSNLLSTLLLSFQLGRYTPITKPIFQNEYDYIIVGAGSAGSTIAARLSEKSCVNILLLEAGRSPSFLTEVPGIARIFAGSSIDWKYFTTSQKHTASSQIDRKVPFSLGKAIGGSSTWNAMLFVRGNRLDYDSWAANGATGWSYNEVLPYFKKLEDNKEEEFSNSYYHGQGGPYTAERPGYNPTVKKAAFKAALELGYPINDANGENQYGFYDFTASMRNGKRCSTGKAYLVPAENRTNLDIIADTFVEKVVIENKRAVGVVVRGRTTSVFISAKQEVILSAGAIHTPQLLMMSGIGPKEHLKELKIPVIADLPVGQNFHDHAGSILPYVISSLIPGYLPKIISPISIAQYLLNGTGPLSCASGVNTLAFLRADRNASSELKPDYELYFIEAAPIGAREQVNMKHEDYNAYFGHTFANNVVWCLSQITVPKSRGSITLNLTNPQGPPLIDPNYLSHPDDLKLCVEGMKHCNEVYTSNSFKELNAKPFTAALPGCEEYLDDLEKLFTCHAKAFIISIGHPVGTAKMGSPNDATTVVDPGLRVKGIANLRVVDASVMPTIPSGNTNVPTIMIAEKASDIIKQSIPC